MNTMLPERIIFAGRYRIVRCLAAGGMGAVYEAIHLETDRRRALKVMHAHLFDSDEMRERFKREARIAAHVESEYIVDVSDAGVDEATGTPYLVMELLRGEELGDRLKRLGRLPAAEVITYLQQAAWALDKTHAASIVHRDLKPDNLFVTQREDGSARIKILDFGVAKLVAEGATGAGATRSLGTPLYMSPEQFRTNAPLTGAADIYALGMMAYTLLVGQPYWSSEAASAGDVIAFAMEVIRGPVEPPVRRALSRGVALPPAFDAWFGRVSATNPADRHPTATEAVRALREVLETGISAQAMVGFPVSTSRTATPITGLPMGTGSPLNPGLPLATMTLPNSAVTHAPMERSRSPLLAIPAVLVLAMLGVGTWAVIRGRGPAEVSTPAPVAITASPAADSGSIPASVASAETPSASSPSAVAEVALPPSGAPASPALDAGVDAPLLARAPVSRALAPKPGAGSKASTATTPKAPVKSGSMLGRD